MNSGGKSAIRVIVIDGKKLQQNCYCCPPVLLEDNGNGDQCKDKLSSKTWKGGGDDNKDDCEGKGDNRGFGEMNWEDDSNLWLDKNDGVGEPLKGRPLIIGDSRIPQGSINWLKTPSVFANSRQHREEETTLNPGAGVLPKDDVY